MQGKASIGSMLPIACIAVLAAGMGLLMAGLAWPTAYQWKCMRDWVEVPAIINHVELVEEQGTDDAIFRVSVVYTYTYEGRKYTGTGIGLHSYVGSHSYPR